MHPALDAARRALLLERRDLRRDELVALGELSDADVPALLELAADVRDHYCGTRVLVCTFPSPTDSGWAEVYGAHRTTGGAE